MKQKVKLTIVTLILITILGITISYAITPEEKTKFFEVNNTEISPGETLEMSINISNIEYNELDFKLISNIDNGKVYTDIATSESEEINVDIDLDDSEDLIVKLDKSKLKLDKVALYYKIPENTQIGTKIELQAQILVNNLGEENTTVEDNILINSEEDVEDGNYNDTTSDLSSESVSTVVLEGKIEVTIIEKKEKDTNNNKESNQTSQEQISNQNQMQQTNNTPNSTTATLNNTSTVKTSQTKETAVYNGSNNNYLSALTIKDVTLNTTFNKENTTYFATVENKTKLTITATKEDSDATVCIIGADDIEEGENKILISVTAEDGNVRYYRIFITNNITEGE